MTIDTILFDLDGTLVQHSHVLLPEQLEVWGHPRPATLIEEAFAIQIAWLYEHAAELQAAGQATAEMFEQVWWTIYQRVAQHLEIDDEEIVHQMGRFFATEPTPPLFEDTIPLLETLAETSWQLGIITQRGRLGATQFLRDHGLLERFHIIVAGDDGFGRKPAPDPFHRALNFLDCHAERAIFVGDRIDDDCGGACQAGLTAFLIDRDNRYVHWEPGEQSIAFTRLTTLLELTEHLPMPVGEYQDG